LRIVIQPGARAVEKVMSAPLLVVFADEPHRGKVRRGADLAATVGEVRRACLAEVVAAGARAGCRVVVASPQPVELPGAVGWIAQPTQGSFAQRLESCLVAAASWQGPDGRTMVVAADIPELAAADLELAATALSRDPESVVVGPSPDGGVYLLGWCGAAPPLAGVSWCTRTTRQGVQAAIRASARALVVLTPRRDLDVPGDLSGLRRRRHTDDPLGRVLRWAIACLRRALRPPAWCEPWSPVTPVRCGSTVRGPPVSAV
jgi:glycosyltransferase A (GT-A) superfamily protein (DUF2064 family)